MRAFVARHELVGDDGHPLHLELSRLRKTQKAERYLRTQGQLDDFAVGHTVAVAARHYANIPALRHVHERTIADALQDALESALKMTLLPPVMEEAARVRPEAAGLPVSAIRSRRCSTASRMSGWQVVAASMPVPLDGREKPARPHSGDAWTVRMR